MEILSATEQRIETQQQFTSASAGLIPVLTRVAKRFDDRNWEDHLVDRMSQALDQEASLLQTDLTAALASLNGDQRAALLHVTENELSCVEAADGLGISVAAFRTRVFRARKSVMAFPENGLPAGGMTKTFVGLTPLTTISRRSVA